MNMENPPRDTVEVCVRMEHDPLWGDEKECGWMTGSSGYHGRQVNAKKWGDQEAREIVCALISREEHHKIYHSGKLISWSR